MIDTIWKVLFNLIFKNPGLLRRVYRVMIGRQSEESGSRNKGADQIDEDIIEKPCMENRFGPTQLALPVEWPRYSINRSKEEL